MVSHIPCNCGLLCHTHTIHYQSYKISNIHVIKEAVGRFDRSKHGLESSTDSQEAVGRFDRSKHGLEPSTDSQEAVGHFDRSKHGLEPSTDSQKLLIYLKLSLPC